MISSAGAVGRIAQCLNEFRSRRGGMAAGGGEASQRGALQPAGVVGGGQFEFDLAEGAGRVLVVVGRDVVVDEFGEAGAVLVKQRDAGAVGVQAGDRA